MIARCLIGIIRIYQIVLGPLFGNCCRFHPSCSRYGMEAIRKHGPWKGLALGMWRLLRCHPLSPGGLDPVPEPAPTARSKPADKDAFEDMEQDVA